MSPILRGAPTHSVRQCTHDLHMFWCHGKNHEQHHKILTLGSDNPDNIIVMPILPLLLLFLFLSPSPSSMLRKLTIQDLTKGCLSPHFWGSCWCLTACLPGWSP